MMTPEERKAMRFGQVERYLASDMSVKQWCKLNRVGESTLYTWMQRYRKDKGEQTEELDARQKSKATSGWIELSREALAASVALAPATAKAGSENATEPSGEPACLGGRCGVEANEALAYARAKSPGTDGGRMIAVGLNGARVGIPPGSDGRDIRAVLEAVACL